MFTLTRLYSPRMKCPSQSHGFEPFLSRSEWCCFKGYRLFRILGPCQSPGAVGEDLGDHKQAYLSSRNRTIHNPPLLFLERYLLEGSFISFHSPFFNEFSVNFIKWVLTTVNPSLQLLSEAPLTSLPTQFCVFSLFTQVHIVLPTYSWLWSSTGAHINFLGQDVEISFVIYYKIKHGDKY